MITFRKGISLVPAEKPITKQNPLSNPLHFFQIKTFRGTHTPKIFGPRPKARLKF